MWHKIKASLYRDTKELFRNMTLLTSMLLPLLLAGMFHFTVDSITVDEIEAGLVDRMMLIQSYLIIGITLMSVLTFNITTSMAEENEKEYFQHFIHTERDYQATIWSKVILYSVVSVFTLIIVMIIFNPPVAFGVYDVIGIACIFIVFILLGIAIGLTAKSVSQTSVFIIPFMIFIVMTPMAEVIFGVYNEVAISLLWFNLLYLNMMIYEGQVWQGMLGNAIYIGISLLLVVFSYRHKKQKI